MALTRSALARLRALRCNAYGVRIPGLGPRFRGQALTQNPERREAVQLLQGLCPPHPRPGL